MISDFPCGENRSDDVIGGLVPALHTDLRASKCVCFFVRARARVCVCVCVRTCVSVSDCVSLSMCEERDLVQRPGKPLRKSET